MFARKEVFSSIGRAATLATVAALALTAVEPMAYAGSAPKEKGVTAATGTSDATDISARRYYRGGPYYYGDGYYGGHRSGVPYYRGHPNAGW